MDALTALKLHDELLASRPEGSQHDSDICAICVDKASQAEIHRPIPPASGGPDVSEHQTESQTNTEGGTTRTMTDISQDAHDALVTKAVADATAATDKALADKAAENTELAAKVTDLSAQVSTLTEDNKRLNTELDKAQVDLKAATDKVEALEVAQAKAKEDAEKAELASKRLDQVKNLGVFQDEFLTNERASHWAELSEEDWAARTDEWSQLKPVETPEGDETKKTEVASAITGASETGLTEDGTDSASKTTTPARRAVLGLT